MVQVLKQCGDDLSRENVMRQAASLRDYEPVGLLPGIKINTGAEDFRPIKQMRLMQFDGRTWQQIGHGARNRVFRRREEGIRGAGWSNSPGAMTGSGVTRRLVIR
jgi:hypothetical protein